MTTLHRKLFRDLIHMRGQAFAIVLVIACGVASFVTMRAMYRSLLRSQADYYAQYRFPDIFAAVKRAPEGVAKRIREIPGVAEVKPRVVMDVMLDVPGLAEPAVGRLISIRPGERGGLNDLFLRRGRFMHQAAGSEVIASEAFAKANGLVPGNQIDAVINGRWQRLTIVGIALSPEYIYEIRGSGSLFPDNKRFGVLWISADALTAALNMKGAFNSIVVSLQPHASEAAVIAQMDRILERYGSLGAYGRSDQISHRFISDEIAQNRISATVIPAIFLAVAALLVHLSFSRLVNMQRSEIAVIKAFGYSNWQVGAHYVQFSVLIGMAGCLLGCVVGWYFGIRLAAIYAEFYRFPILVYRPELRIFLWAVLITGSAALAGAIAPVMRAVALPPAEAMRPEAPPRFRSRIIDRLRPGWISPGLRMTLRNLERQPWRALASAFAICCSVMIVVVVFGMFDALDRMMEIQFRDAQREDIVVTLNEVHSARTRLELARLPGVIRSEPFRIVPVRLSYEHRSKKTTLLGLLRGSEMRPMIDRNGKSNAIPRSGIMISATLADALHVRPGEKLRVEVLEGSRTVREVLVAATVDDLLGANAYMDLHALNRMMQEDHSISGALLQVDAAKQQELYQLLKRLPAVAAVSIKDAEVNSFKDTIDRSMGLSLGTLMIFACIIAMGMIYNGARIALSERGRELATLRVLGFTRNEITALLLGEQAIITIAALPFGFIAGYAICAVMVERMQTELYRMPLVVYPSSYAWAVLIVLIAAAVSGLLVSRRIAKLDIVSVLKARE
ncbi:ABC transporter permease [Acidipila rosea]|uniref:Putative ABC transport system permease protein n=1 Tax=Acidipila rosea TaxID=768535 RepID=A0A4V2PV06_9BACT|nr:FtsX-like permease family protein [Acidipila rosea]TCK72501.1 putative ABC transport system permease protein [Acidipila rosea]